MGEYNERRILEVIDFLQDNDDFDIYVRDETPYTLSEVTRFIGMLEKFAYTLNPSNDD